MMRLVIQHQRPSAIAAKTVRNGRTRVFINRVDILDANVASIHSVFAALDARNRHCRAQFFHNAGQLRVARERREFFQQTFFNRQRRTQNQHAIHQIFRQRDCRQRIHHKTFSRAGRQVKRCRFSVAQRHLGEIGVQTFMPLLNRRLRIPIPPRQPFEVGILV